jgi:hypothetical protein
LVKIVQLVELAKLVEGVLQPPKLLLALSRAAAGNTHRADFGRVGADEALSGVAAGRAEAIIGGGGLRESLGWSAATAPAAAEQIAGCVPRLSAPNRALTEQSRRG